MKIRCSMTDLALTFFMLIFLVFSGCRETPPSSVASGKVPIEDLVDKTTPSTVPSPFGTKTTNKQTVLMPEGYPYEGKPVFIVGRRPVTEKELQRYSARMLGVQEHAKHPSFDTEKIVRSFARYWTVVDMAMEMGWQNDAAVRNVINVYRYAAIANDYREYLEKTYPVSKKTLENRLPRDWTRMEFAIVTLDNDESARKLREEALENRRNLGKEKFEKYVEETFRFKTGPVFRQSGFFEVSEEPYLFGLAEGDISRTVATGIGPGLCYVVRKEVLGGKSREEYIGKVERMIREKEVDAVLGRIASDSRFTVLQDNLTRAVGIEGTTGGRPADTILILHADEGDIPITYKDFRILVPSHYNVYFRSYPQKNWVNFVVPEVKNLGFLYFLGREAVRKGFALNPKWKQEIFDFRYKTIYFHALDRLTGTMEASVSEKEMKKFYQSNKGYFTRKETLKIRYVYGPELEGLRQLVKQAGSKGRIFSAREYSDLVKMRYVVQDNLTHEELFKALRGLKEGEISKIVKADMGYYIAKVDKVWEKGFFSYDEVQEQIRSYLLGQKKQEKVREAINARMRAMEIRKP